MKGIVYVLWNPVFNHYGECYKIGCTNDITKRIKGYTTSYIEPSIIKYKTELREDYKILEKKIHNNLDNYRVKTKREFFKAPLSLIIKSIDELLINNYIIEEDNCKPKQQEEYNSYENHIELLDIVNDTKDIDEIIEQIKSSQYNILKVIERHNLFIKKSLENLQTLLSKDTKEGVKYLKIKDPMDGIKFIKESINNITLFNSSVKNNYLNNIVSILELYKKDKISSSFKDIFLSIFNMLLEGEDNPSIMEFKTLKERILKVRDIRWLLLEIEKYPKLFNFTKDDLKVMEENDSSRDNIYLVKKFLKDANCNKSNL